MDIRDSNTKKQLIFGPCVGINVGNTQIKSKITFDLGELMRQTDTVHTKCKLLIN